MDENEFEQLLHFIQRRMREAGLGGLDERIVSELRTEQPPPSVQLDRYLRMLRGELSLGTNDSVRRVLGRLRRIADVDQGGDIDGIDVVMTAGDAEIYGTSVVNLGGLPELDDLLEELGSLAAELRESRDEGPWR